MKINDILLSEAPYQPSPNDVVRMPRGKMQRFAGTAPVTRLTPKQQQVKDQQAGGPRAPVQPQQKQTKQAKQQPVQPPAQQPPQQTPEQLKTKEAIKQVIGVEEITADNILDIVPKLVQKFKDDTNFVNQIVNVVATSVSTGQEFIQSANALQQQNKQSRQTGGKPVSAAGNPTVKAQKIYNNAVTLPKDEQRKLVTALRTSLGEAVQATSPAAAPAAAPALNPSQVQQLILAQIKAAVKASKPEVRKVLKARVQQATLLKPGEQPDPNKVMQHGQPVVGKSGLRQPKGPLGRAAAGFKNFLGRIPG